MGTSIDSNVRQEEQTSPNSGQIYQVKCNSCGTFFKALFPYGTSLKTTLAGLTCPNDASTNLTI